MRWRWVGTRKAVVGRWRRSAPSAVAASKRLRMASDPPESSVPAEKRMETVWYIGEHTRCRSSRSKRHTAASSSKTARAVRLVPDARGHALGPARGARGVVHGPGERVRGQLGRGCPRPARPAPPRRRRGRRARRPRPAGRARPASSVALSRTGISPTRAAPSTAQTGRPTSRGRRPTRSPRLQPRASRAPAARRWRSSASAASSSSTVGASRGHRPDTPGSVRPAPRATMAPGSGRAPCEPAHGPDGASRHDADELAQRPRPARAGAGASSC